MARSIDSKGADRSALSASGFDYSALPAELAKQQQKRAARIISIERRTVELMSEIGRELTEAQADFEHGTFLRWIEEATHLSRSSAYRFMDVFKVFGAILPKVRNLPPTIVQALAAPSTPEPMRDAVLKRLEKGEALKSNAVLAEIRMARKTAREASVAEREAARREAMTLEQRQTEDQTNIENAKNFEKYYAAASAQEAEIATFLLNKIGEDDLADLRIRFGFSKIKTAVWMATTQALVQRAAHEPSIELSAAMLMPLHYYLENRHRPEIETEIYHVAELIKAGEPVRAITVLNITGSEYYDIVGGNLTFLAFTQILGRTSVPVKVVPANRASASGPKAPDVT